MKLLFAAVAALALSGPVMAQDQYRLRSAADLAQLCSPAASDQQAATSLAFCHGALAGAYAYFEETTPAADRFVCPPTPAVTRTQVANAFVAWLKARPQYRNDAAIDTLFRFAAEAYPCKK